MSKQNLLPQKVDLFRFTENEINLEGVMPIKEMQRLCPSLSDDAGDVRVNVVFGVDEQGIRFVRGHYDAHLMLKCQRCMETFEHQVSGDLLLGIVSEENEVQMHSKGYDVVVASDGMLSLHDIIEDELIIGLPIVPVHSSKNCKVTLPLVIGSAPSAEVEQENPFKVIELLRSKRNIDKV